MNTKTRKQKQRRLLAAPPKEWAPVPVVAAAKPAKRKPKPKRAKR